MAQWFLDELPTELAEEIRSCPGLQRYVRETEAQEVRLERMLDGWTDPFGRYPNAMTAYEIRIYGRPGYTHTRAGGYGVCYALISNRWVRGSVI